MESEFVPMELAWRASDLGYGGAVGNCHIEQLERWTWEKHRELFPQIDRTVPDVLRVFVYGVSVDFVTGDPFSARLAGVTRVIEELEKGVK